MTVPRFLQSTFQFDENEDIADAADIVTNLKAILLAQTPAWTNPSGDIVKSPVDSAGRFMTIALSAPTSSRFQMLIKDQDGIQVATREISLITGPLPTKINYYTGQYHCYVESLTNGSGNGEWVAAMMIDPTGYDLGANQSYVIAGGTRNSGGANDGSGSVCDQWFMLESGTPQLRQRARSVFSSTGVNVGLIDFAGNPQFFPFDVQNNPSGTVAWMGSMYQAYVTDLRIGGGVTKPVAIDNATPAQFRTTIAPATAQGMKMALRVA